MKKLPALAITIILADFRDVPLFAAPMWGE